MVEPPVGAGTSLRYISNREMGVEWTPDGRPQGPSYTSPPERIPHPLPAIPVPRQGSPTIQRIGPPRPCIVGAGEDVDVGGGPRGCPSVPTTTSLLLMGRTLVITHK